MTLALTNLDLLHRGWEDAVSEITSHLPEVRATMETEYAALQHEDRIDEQALLAAVREVAAVAARAAGADKARLLSRSMHRSVYEYLLSLDAMTAEEADGETPANGAVTDPSRLIGMEEVAELEGRQAALQAEAEAAAAAIAAAELAAAERAAAERAAAERAAAEAQAAAERAAAEERAAEERAAAERVAAEQAAAARAAAHRAAAERAAAERVASEQEAAERAAAYRASLEQSAALAGPEPDALAGLQAALDDAVGPDVDDEAGGGGHYRPRFKIFRRGVPDIPSSAEAATTADGAEDSPAAPGTPAWWRGPDAPPAPEPPSDPATPAAPVEPAAAAASAPPADSGFAVAPRDGFHLTEFADFVRPAAVELEPEAQRDAEPVPSHDGDHGKPRGWHIRSSNRPRNGEAGEVDADAMAPDLDEDAWEERRLIDQDPKISDARGEINDLLRKRRCDDAASLLQKLATDSGGRSVAELALDAGDRCRALGKGNAALSCYIAASRADPSFEGPLMRLADVCLDDRDIDLAVTYLERVARLHRLRGDTRGALRLYRKIATIAPYRDDILATLMRANTTGQFED